MTKGTTMVTNNVFRSTRLFGEGSRNMVLFPLQLMTLRSYMTNHTTMVTSWNKLRFIESLRLRPKWRLWLNNLLSTFWFLLCGGMYTDLSFKVEHTIGTKSSTTTWLQQIFSSFLEIGPAIKHLACILRDSFSHLRSSTSLLNKTSLASKSIFKHSNSFSFSREFSARFLYFLTNLLDSLSLAIKSSFSQK